MEEISGSLQVQTFLVQDTGTLKEGPNLACLAFGILLGLEGCHRRECAESVCPPQNEMAITVREGWMVSSMGLR